MIHPVTGSLSVFVITCHVAPGSRLRANEGLKQGALPSGDSAVTGDRKAPRTNEGASRVPGGANAAGTGGAAEQVAVKELWHWPR